MAPLRSGPNLRRFLRLGLAALLLAGLLVELPPTAAGQQVEDDVLVAPVGAPPQPLSDEARVPPLALLDEDGQRDPDETPLTLLESSAPDDLAADVVDLPTDGAPEADLFAIGSTDAHAATVYPDQVNLEKQNGVWERIGLVADAAGGWSGTFATGSLVFPERLTAETPVTVSFPEGTVSSAPTDAVDAKPGSVTEDTVTYVDALPSTDFVYLLAPQGYKELILLKDKAAAGTVSYSITAPDFDLRLEPTGEVSFLSQGVVVAVVPQPAVWDSSPFPSANVRGVLGQTARRWQVRAARGGRLRLSGDGDLPRDDRPWEPVRLRSGETTTRTSLPMLRTRITARRGCRSRTDRSRSARSCASIPTPSSVTTGSCTRPSSACTSTVDPRVGRSSMRSE